MFDKKISLTIILLVILTGITSLNAVENTQNNLGNSDNIISNDELNIKVNDKVLKVKLENNNATKELIERLKQDNLTLYAKEYGGFEKVANLGFSLPANDEHINTKPGDLVLYNGNQISLFYDSNSWEYTKLGEVQNINESDLKNILGTGDVELILSLN